MKTLLMTPTDIDHNAGGPIRSSHIRDSMARLGPVHTLVIQGGENEYRDSQWTADGIQRAIFTTYGFSPQALRERARIRRWVDSSLRREQYDVIVARYLSIAQLVPEWACSRLVIDADDAIKSIPATQGATTQLRIRLWLRNLVALRTVRRAAHVWFVNPLDGPRLKSKHVSLLRNVIEMPDPGRPRATRAAGRILMVGDFRHPPNAQGLRWFVGEVLPALIQALPGIEMHAVGKYYKGVETEVSNPQFVMRGFVGDLAAEYDTASLVIAPH